MLPHSSKWIRVFVVFLFIGILCENGIGKNDRIKDCHYLSEKKGASLQEATHYFCMTSLDEKKYTKSTITFEIFKIEVPNIPESGRSLASVDDHKMSRIAKRHYSRIEKNVFGSACKARKKWVFLNPSEKSIQFSFLAGNPTYYFTDSK